MPDGSKPWQGYHIYGCKVDPVYTTWYIDGVQTNQIATPTAYLSSPFYIMVDYAIGGGWPLSGAPFATHGSSSLLVDWVRVYLLPPSGIANSSFETPSTSTYIYNPTGGSWTFAGNSGIQHNGSAWNAANAPDGTQTAFLQGNDTLGSISQIVSLNAGSYTLSFQAARRSGQSQPVQVLVDGAAVGGVLTPASSSFQLINMNFTVGSTGNHTISLAATSASGDNSTFIDSVTLSAGAGPTNVALASNGATATASSSYSSGYAASGAINGDRKGLNWGNGGGWNDATSGAYPDWLEVAFSGSKTITEIDVFTKEDGNPVEPTLSTTFTLDGITAFDVQYWNGSSWVTVPNGSVTGNNKVWRQFTFSAITTSKIRVVVNASASADGAYSRITEIEAWALPTVNVALAANGATATASSVYSGGFAANGAINGDRKGLNWGSGGGWNDATSAAYPDWLEVDFSGSETITEIDVFTKEDGNPVEPTLSTTFTLDGITAFDVQYWNGSAWVTVPNGSVTGNNKVWRQFTFSAITTSKIRVVVNASASANGAYSRITEIEAW